MRKHALAMIAAATVAAACAPAQAAFENFNDYMNADGTRSYFFMDEGLTLTMPEDWAEKTAVEVTPYGATFYHEASREAWERDGVRDAGRLFTLGSSVNRDFENLPSFRYLGFDEETCMNYFAVLPTDLQAYAADEATAREYIDLYGQVDDVLGSAKLGTAEAGVEGGASGAETDDGHREVDALGLSFRIPADWEFEIVDGKAAAFPKDDASGFTEIRIERFDKNGTTAGELVESLHGKFVDDHADAVASGPELMTYEPEGTDRRIAGVTGSFSSVDASRVFAQADFVEYVGDGLCLYHCEYVAKTDVPGEKSDAETWERFLDMMDSVEETGKAPAATDVEAWILGG